MKRCKDCGRLLPLSAFYEVKGGRDGYRNGCKECRRPRGAQSARLARAADPEKYRRQNNIWQRENRERRNEQARKYRARHREEINERARRYRAEHPERTGANNRRWEAKHPERRRAHILMNQAIKRGDLLRPEACELCGANKRLSAHHGDYDKPLDVLFLCALCHGAVHRMAKSFLAAVA